MLLVDDIPGATLISGFAFSRWTEVEQLLETARSTGTLRRVEGVCAGFVPGSSGLTPEGTSRWSHRTRVVRLLADDPDPWAWHAVPPEPSRMSMRRMRRVDVWIDGGAVHVDAMFQDSATRRDGRRDAVHECSLSAVADLASRELARGAVRPARSGRHRSLVATGHPAFLAEAGCRLPLTDRGTSPPPPGVPGGRGPVHRRAPRAGRPPAAKTRQP